MLKHGKRINSDPGLEVVGLAADGEGVVSLYIKR